MKDIRAPQVPEPDDDFEVLLRRQGWHLTGVSPAHADQQVIHWRGSFIKASPESGHATFYAAYGDKTLRKILRAVLTGNGSRTADELRRICGDEKKLADMLAYLQAGGVVAASGDRWTRGPQTQDIPDVGHTLEWYVAEWFRHELKAPARHGVKLQEIKYGGDLDVVAFVNDVRVMVECKTGRPDGMSEADARLFLQRVQDFNPEVGVLLFDTESPVETPVRLITNVYAELSAKERGTGETAPHPEAPRPPRIPEEFPGYKGLYWCKHNVFVANVPDSIDASLSRVLRLYHSYVRHQQFVHPVGVWDFVKGTVEKRTEGPISVEGQIWIQF